MELKFYVFNGGGVPLYSYPHEQYDSSLMTSFFVAIHEFSKAITHESINNICTNSKYLYFKKSKKFDIFYAAVAEKKAKNGKVSSKLERIANNFENEYKKLIPSWNGDQKKFRNFDEYFEKSDLERMALIIFGGQDYSKKN